MNSQEIVKKLNEVKKRKKITLKELSEKSGLTLGSIYKIMSGALNDIKTDKLQKIAAVLNIPIEELLTDDDVTYENLNGYCARPVSPYGLVKIACVSPELRVGDCRFNARKIVSAAKKAASDGAKVILFPELCLTGYSCGDLFFQQTLRMTAERSLLTVCKQLATLPAVVAVGLPLTDDTGNLFNAAAILYGGKILGIVPKTNLPNYGEFSEKRFFVPAGKINSTIRVGVEDNIPFGTRLLFINKSFTQMTFAAEICEDIWVTDSPSFRHADAGANLILNLSASNEIICKAAYRRKLVELQSAKSCTIYAYCSSGMTESTSNVVFSAHNMICENGEFIGESAPFGDGYTVAEADFDFICNERARLHCANAANEDYLKIFYDMPVTAAPTRIYDSSPFVPKDQTELASRCETVLNLQAYGLKQRISHINASKLVIGVSGGTDSSLALLACCRAMKLLERNANDIIAVTMPCFGTTQRTLNNSVALAKALGATVKKIDISAAVTQHLKDISHNGSLDTTFENAQARERTQVLMDIANSCNGLVVGTGDLSENALGWSTFNGDQMSMYAVNGDVPKTLVKAILAYEATKASANLKQILTDILDTPVSPELLPPAENGMSQITENIVGPYELHDYFLYMTVRKGFSPSKVYTLAKLSFDGKFKPEEIRFWLNKFIKRFFSQQFKRSCQPDSVKIGTVDLSKYSWRMPSDACCDMWLSDLEAAPL